jgi:hypothetical protein
LVFVDFSGTSVAAILAHVKYTNDFDEKLCRHIVLVCLLSYRKKFSHEYGDLIICCDPKDGPSWRKQLFPYYKAKRRSEAGKSPINWTLLFEAVQMVERELREHMPYKVVRTTGTPLAEADDIIAILARHLPGKHLIVSNDKDFHQLHTPTISQYRPLKESIINIPDPARALKELIIRGDVSDGVPNILSDDDTFVVKEKRQKPVTEKKVAVWLNQTFDQFAKKEFAERNIQLIDFDRIPVQVKDNILVEYQGQSPNSRDKILPYFAKSGLRNLITDIHNF